MKTHYDYHQKPCNGIRLHIYYEILLKVYSVYIISYPVSVPLIDIVLFDWNHTMAIPLVTIYYYNKSNKYIIYIIFIIMCLCMYLLWISHQYIGIPILCLVIICFTIIISHIIRFSFTFWIGFNRILGIIHSLIIFFTIMCPSTTIII